jgi:hypothetical protein
VLVLKSHKLVDIKALLYKKQSRQQNIDKNYENQKEEDVQDAKTVVVI